MKNWQSLVVQSFHSIKDAMNLFEKNNAQIVLVVDESNVLLGTVTDGDIRRGLLKFVNLTDSVITVMNPKPITAFAHTLEDEVLKKISNLDIKYVPIVDEKRKIKGVYSKEDFSKVLPKDNPVIIMAGGDGIRLRPLTENLPKPLVDINGCPIIERLLLQLIDQGFGKFYLSVNYLGEMIENYFGDGKKWGVEISYLKEDQKLGTAGSLHLLKSPNKDLIVLNGDLVTSINFKQLLAFHSDEKADVTIGIQHITFRVPYGVVNYTEVKVDSLEEKPVLNYHVNCGIYVVNPKCLNEIRIEEKIDMTCLINRLIDKKYRVLAFPIYEEWHDIGNIRDLEKVRGIYK